MAGEVKIESSIAIKEKGVVFITVMVIAMLIIFIGVSVSNMLLQDVYMIRRLKYSSQAQYLAEAGISDALATLAKLGFSAKNNSANFPQKKLGKGTYDVTIVENSGRVILSSSGQVEGVSRIAMLEVKDNTPTALYNMMSSGSDMMIRALLLGWADINGDLHSNADMLLHALWSGWIDVDTCGSDCCDGSVSASGGVKINEGSAGNVTYHGSLVNGAPPVTFPNFDYTHYKNLALEGGEGVDYFNGDKTWEDETLTPENGVVYVEGTARFRGSCDLYGGIVADRILILGSLDQHKSGTNNVIISRTMDIRVYVKFGTEEAVVYSGRDFRIFNAGSIVNVTGTLIAARYLRAWDALSYITYNHRLLYPDGLELGPSGVPIEVVSWNR